MVNKLSTNTYYVGEAQAIISFAALPGEAKIDAGNNARLNMNDFSVEYRQWGKQNNVPHYREELISGNNIVPALLERKRNIFLGQSFYAYRERFENTPDGPMKRIVDEVPIPQEAKAFLQDFRKVARDIVGELMKHSMAMPEFIRNGAGEIISCKSLEVKYIRAAKKVKGLIPEYYWYNNWDGKEKTVDKVFRNLPIYDPSKTGPKRQDRFVYPIGDYMFNDGYYPIPTWWGSRHWINLANIIPLFHEANLKNGMAPRWHIIIPNDYFYDYQKMDGATTEEERANLLKEFQAKEQQFVDDFNEVMTGIGNSGRTLVTKSELLDAMGAVGKEKKISIEPLKPDMQDEALIKLYEASNVAAISAQAMHPSLANIETAGKLSSGTEIRNAFLLYLIIAAPVVREMIIDLINMVKRENQWPENIHFGIRDAEMTTLAENPAGVRPAQTQVAQ